MSTLYQIKVLECPDASSCVLDIRSVHPDAKRIACSPGFALMLLWDKATGYPLREMVDLTTIMDKNWSQQNALGYVQSVGLSDIGIKPPSGAKDDPAHPYWKKDRFKQAKMHLTLTHPAWRSHLKPGMTWDSATFSPAQHYDTSDPVLPGNEAITLEVDPTASEGFFPIPSFALDPDKLPGLSEQKEIYYLPIYGESAYEAVDKIGGDRLLSSNLSPWIGFPVLFSENGRITLGTLLNVEKSTDRFFYCTSWGGGYQPLRKLDWMAQTAFKKGKQNLVAETSVTKLIRRHPILLSSDIKDNTATLRLIHLKEGSDLSAYPKNMILGMIASPLIERLSRYKFITQAPLALALNYELDRLGQERFFDFELYPKVVNGYIVSFSITAPQCEMPDLDAMSGEELIAFYQKGKWPHFTLTIELSDPAWVEHLKGKKRPLGKDLNFDQSPLDELETRIWSEIKTIAMASKRNKEEK